MTYVFLGGILCTTSVFFGTKSEAKQHGTRSYYKYGYLAALALLMGVAMLVDQYWNMNTLGILCIILPSFIVIWACVQHMKIKEPDHWDWAAKVFLFLFVGCAAYAALLYSAYLVMDQAGYMLVLKKP